MKKYLLSLLLSTLIFAALSQTATDFTAPDCTGLTHNLFTELDEGKIIVLVWVMPCAACTGPTKTTYNVVQSYHSSHPDKVFLYMADDYANTSCPSINSWSNSNGMTKSTIFSNSSIKMSDYGSEGMPKVVVLGGAEHKVFYNANYTVNSVELQKAINEALATSATSDTEVTTPKIIVSPNPANKTSEIKFSMEKSGNVSIKLYDVMGHHVKNIFSANKETGEHSIFFDISNLPSGPYLLKFSQSDFSKTINFMITR